MVALRNISSCMRKSCVTWAAPSSTHWYDLLAVTDGITPPETPIPRLKPNERPNTVAYDAPVAALRPLPCDSVSACDCDLDQLWVSECIVPHDSPLVVEAKLDVLVLVDPPLDSPVLCESDSDSVCDWLSPRLCERPSDDDWLDDEDTLTPLDWDVTVCAGVLDWLSEWMVWPGVVDSPCVS